MNPTKYHAAIEGGARTAREIAESVGRDYTHVSRELKEYAESGDLTREKDGRSWVYGIPEESPDNSGTAPDSTGAPDLTAGDGLMPVNRDYDWSEYVPTDIPEYKPSNGEYEEIKADLAARDVTGRMPRYRLVGPTGSGKTHLAQYLGFEESMPVFTVQLNWSVDDNDLKGRPIAVQSGSGVVTQFQDGPVTKALIASRDRPVILLLDEVNRAPPEAKASLMSALDDRAELTLEKRGGETVKGDPMNLIVIATMNDGREYATDDLDLAERRRLGATYDVNYLGVNYPDREAQILTERTPATPGFADLLVTAANDVRQRAADDMTRGGIRRGLPTGLLIDWARTAAAFADGDIDNPAVKAMQAAVIRPFYSDSEAKETVVETLKSRVDGVPVNDPEYAYGSDPDADPSATGGPGAV